MRFYIPRVALWLTFRGKNLPHHFHLLEFTTIFEKQSLTSCMEVFLWCVMVCLSVTGYRRESENIKEKNINLLFRSRGSEFGFR